MSGRGETPEKHSEETESVDVEPGETLYTEDGTAIGQVRGMEEGGLFVTLREGVEGLSVEHARAGQSFGEAELMWRCLDCGQMGEIEGGLPDSCPNCEAEREDLMYWTED